MDSLSAVLRARALLDTLTPLKTDCGRLCGGACCQGDETTGMLLFPGEDALYERCAFGRVLPAGFSLGGAPTKLFVCEGRCPRENRPLACRLFPLFLAFTKGGGTRVRMDTRAASVCPLYACGAQGLDAAFVDAVQQAYDALLADETCAAYLHDLYRACRL